VYMCALQHFSYSQLALNNTVCCKQGAGGPIELFDGPISDNKLLFEDSFQGTNRLSHSFVREGGMSSSAFKASQVLGGIFCVPILLFWLL
jgi:hypothetical protein